MKVTQVLSAAGPVDAVSNQARAFRRLFDGWGWRGRDYAAVVATDMPRGAVRPLSDLRGGEDVVVLHYSGYGRDLEALLERDAPTLLISHNVTPARYFWDAEPVEAVRCEMARSQLPVMAQRATRIAGVSRYNARELEEMTGRAAEVIPILFASPGAGAPEAAGAPAPEPEGAPVILFVGRLVPHKRQDLVLRVFARLRERRPDARLVLVGTPLNPRYGTALRDLADRLAPGGVSFASGIADAQLEALYRGAHVFLCLSEHEGFCIPLLEAFAHGIPVVARAAAAVPEVIADAGVLLEPDDGVDVAAELVDILLRDGELRAELRARGRRRLRDFSAEQTARQIRDVIEGLR